MNPPERTQVETDAEREYYGELSAITCTAEEDKARQEFRKETDLNELLRRFGAVPPPRVPGGEWDFDISLASAMDSVRTVREGYKTLPSELRDLYKTPQDLIDAVLRGEVTYKSGTEVAGGSGASGADSPSEAPAGPKSAPKKDPEGAPDKA